MPENGDVLVDSSVWVDYFNGDHKTVEAVNSLITTGRIVICGQIRQEVLQGSRDDKAFTKLQQQMELWQSAEEAPGDFIEAARIFARLRWKGITVPPADCLIAAVAVRQSLLVYANDTDFDRIPHIRRYRP